MKYDQLHENAKSERIRQSKSRKRTLVRDKSPTEGGTFVGQVVEVGTKLYVVRYSANDQWEDINCFAAGSLSSPHKFGTLICCGDMVRFSIYESADVAERAGTIHEVVERRSKISRIDPANHNREHVISSNFDQLIIFLSVFDPDLNTRLIDRLLIAAQLGKVEPIIVLNKTDLADMEIIDEIMLPYYELGYKIFNISLRERLGIEDLLLQINGSDNVMVGPSGVGKSSFLNFLMGEQVQQVREISETSGKGKHTTSFIKRFTLPTGGTITDTPGIREFGIWDLSPDELTLFFKDFENYFHDCKYLPCTHTHEPNCHVKLALEQGLISNERYESYLNILESLEKQ